MKPDVDEIDDDGAGRRWWGRVALAVLGALLVPLLLEGVLRVAGYGYPTSFLLPYTKDGERVWVDNQFFGYRFFPQKATRTAQPIVVPRDKAAGEYRVVVLGESAAMGDPLPDFGLPRVLEVVLADRMPGRRVRVINAAMTAINSHVVREIAHELPRLQPDAVVVYMGNNEVIGPYGPGTVLRPFAASGAYIRGSVLLGRTRLGQLLARGRGAAAREPEGWGGMTMFLDRQIPWKDPSLDDVYEHFSGNLEAVLKQARRSGAQTVVGTVAVSRRDCPPFGSAHATSLGEAARGDADRLWTEGLRAEAEERFDQATRAYEELLLLDDGHAEAHYRLARCLERAGREADAELQYIAACDRDTLRFRADTRINEFIRRAARRTKAAFVDTVKAFRHVEDAEAFVDHVHFSLGGNVRLARLFADALAPVSEPARTLEDDARLVASALAYTPWDDVELVETIRERMEHPPFSGQRESKARLDHLRALERALADRARGESRERMLARYTRALEQRPDDGVLHARFAGRLFEEGDLAGAESELAKAVAASPHRFDIRGDWAHVLASLGRGDDALGALRAIRPPRGHFLDHILRRIADGLVERGEMAAALPLLDELARLHPEDSFHALRAAEARLRAGRPGEAAAALQRMAEASPDSARVLALLGLARLDLGATNDALRLLDEATRRDPASSEVAYSLGYARLRAGDKTGAEASFRKVVQIDPSDEDALLRLAQLLVERGEAVEAAARYEQLADLQADSKDAQYAAARALATAGRFAAAKERFERALALTRDDVLLLNDLAWLLATCPEDAVRDGRRALELALRADALTQYGDPVVVDSLAASYAELGGFSGAVEAARRALSLAQEPLAGCISQRLALYEAGHPYRESAGSTCP